MPFPESVKDAAFRRSGGRCECQRQNHGHAGRCSTAVTRHGAHYHHKHAESLGGPSTLSNCEVLCVPCHKKTESWGRH